MVMTRILVRTPEQVEGKYADKITSDFMTHLSAKRAELTQLLILHPGSLLFNITVKSEETIVVRKITMLCAIYM